MAYRNQYSAPTDGTGVEFEEVNRTDTYVMFEPRKAKGPELVYQREVEDAIDRENTPDPEEEVAALTQYTCECEAIAWQARHLLTIFSAVLHDIARDHPKAIAGHELQIAQAKQLYAGSCKSNIEGALLSIHHTMFMNSPFFEPMRKFAGRYTGLKPASSVPSSAR